MATLRHTRYQAAIVQHGAILLVRCQFADGTAFWMLPGGGRDEREDDVTCVAREIAEETLLHVRVERLVCDLPAQPPDGTYTRWRTYLCSVMSGEAAPGGGEGDSASLVAVTWLPIAEEQHWPDEIRADPFLYPQLVAIAIAVRQLTPPAA
jgi:8-oxo-dGTP pyrophosphatase MutT (NUDIX family)